MHANAGYGQNMALGYYASVANGVSNSTALGYGSQVTKRDILQSDGSDGVVSVGKSVGQSGEKGMTRRIINVKDGVKATDAANVSQLTELKEGEHISITDSATPNEKGQTVKTISVKVDGEIKPGNTGILSGGTVYNEVHVDQDGNYIKADNTVAGNLKALDSKVKTNADNIEKNGKAIDQNKARIETNSNNIQKNGQAIEQNKSRIETNSKNIEVNSKAIEQNSSRIDTNAKNIEANSKAIEQNSARIDTNSKNIGILQETKADINLSNLTKAGKTVVNNIAKEAVKVEAGSSNVSVTTKDETNGPITYTVDIAKDLNVNSVTSNTITSNTVTSQTVTSDAIKTKDLTVSDAASIGNVTINKDGKGTIGGLTNTTWDAAKITSGQAATEDQLKAATKNAVNYDGDDSKSITLREDTTIKNVANTAIEQGSKNAVNAGTVYNETRVKQDGKYVKASNTAGENLSVLDNQVASNSSNITNLNGRVNNLDSKVNKVGAGAAALAALHPLDFDPEDKWDFAVGYGNYRDANSVAVGAFYRPDDDTMFSVGTNFGNGENMINAGVSFKFGPKGKSQVLPGSTQEITELRATVARQGDIAGRRAMLLLAVCSQLAQIVSGLREVIEVDAGAHTARPDFGMQLCCRFLREVHAELRRPIMSRLEVVQLHGQERIVGIDAADAFLAQRPFHMRKVVDDATEVLLEVIPRGRLRIDVRLRDVLHRERSCGWQMAKIVHPCEDLLDFCFFPENFLELSVEVDELLLIHSRQEVEVRAVEDLLDLLEAQAQLLVVLDDVERRALQDIVDAVAVRRVDVHRLQESVLVVKAQCRQRRMVEFGHLADR